VTDDSGQGGYEETQDLRNDGDANYCDYGDDFADTYISKIIR
jgi:hypothetical protein